MANFFVYFNETFFPTETLKSLFFPIISNAKPKTDRTYENARSIDHKS